LLLIAGSIAIHDKHEVYTTLLVAVAIGVLGAFLLIEPTTTRAAFSSVSKPASDLMQKSQNS
jgi:hypothetical protein